MIQDGEINSGKLAVSKAFGVPIKEDCRQHYW